MQRVGRYVLMVFTLFLFIGCNKPTQGVSIAFEELGGEVGHKNGYATTAYRSSVSVSGLGQNQIVGSILTVPGQNIPDTYSIPIITGCSKVAVTEYATEATQKDVRNVRDALDTLVQYSTTLALLEAEQLILGEWMDKLHSIKDQTKEANQIKETIIRLYELQGITKEHNISEIFRALELPKQAFSRDITEINKEIALTKHHLQKAREKSGLVITNWSRVQEGNGSVALGAISSGSSSMKKRRGGYLILAGIRIESLWLGDDFAMYISQRKEHALTGSDSILSPYGFIVTFSISAKYRAYSESLDYKKVLSSKLNAQISELSKLVGKDYRTYLKEYSLRLSKSIDNAVRSANSGFLSSPKKQLFEYRFVKDKAFAQSMIASYQRSNGYLPVYAVRSNIADLKKYINNVPEAFQYECRLYQGIDGRFYNYKSSKEENRSKPCSLENCSLVDLENPIGILNR